MLYTERLKDEKLFRRIYGRGSYTVTDLFTAYYLANKQGFNRVGFSVGKKLGNAVARNRAKRILREAYRTREIEIPIGFDIIFAARAGIVKKKTPDCERLIKSRLIPDMNRRAVSNAGANSNAKAKSNGKGAKR